jgi:hypothetical protein
MIPKVLYLYWGGRKLSWLRYLTVVSFKKHNPDWEVRVYCPAHPTTFQSWTTDEQRVKYDSEDYLPKLRPTPFDMSTVGMTNDMPEVHKSDIFRLWVLHEYGGVYSDFDILYCKPLPKVRERWFCLHPNNHYAIGLLAAEKGDGIYKWLLESIKSRTDTDKYQSFGSVLWGTMLDGSTLEGWNMPKDFVYSTSWEEAEDLFTEDKKLPREAAGVHWYGGSAAAGKWENILTPGTYKEHKSTITNLVKDIV